MININVELKKDRDEFYQDERVKGIVFNLLKDNTPMRNEVMALINLAYNYDDFEKKSFKISTAYNKSPELLQLFWDKYIPYLYGLYKDSQVSNYRGAILEKYVYELLHLKYQKRECLSINCKVYINDTYSGGSIDAFYYSQNEDLGESYECKISPYFLNKNDVDTLLNIFQWSEYKIKPCIASFHRKKAIILRLEELFCNSSHICIYGPDNLTQIISN